MMLADEIPNPIVTPAQWAELNSPRWVNAEEMAENAKIKRLMWAILNDALDCLNPTKPREGKKITPGLKRILRMETLEWINSNERGPFSFLTVCEVFDVDPERLRARLRSTAPAPMNHRNLVAYGYMRVVDTERRV